MSVLSLANVMAAREAPLTLALRFLDVPVRVFTDDVDVWAGLRRYYAPWVVDDVTSHASAVTLLQGKVDAGPGFHDVVRADGRK